VPRLKRRCAIASGAELLSGTAPSEELLAAVLPRATLPFDAHPESTTSSVYALPAGKRSWQTGMAVPKPAHGSAVKIIAVHRGPRRAVGCISVPGMGAFLAAGVVVSNCAYGVAYASQGAKGIAKPRKLSGKEEHSWDDLDELEEREERRRDLDGSGGANHYLDDYL
jgi:hypothetical protein